MPFLLLVLPFLHSPSLLFCLFLLELIIQPFSFFWFSLFFSDLSILYHQVYYGLGACAFLIIHTLYIYQILPSHTVTSAGLMSPSAHLLFPFILPIYLLLIKSILLFSNRHFWGLDHLPHNKTHFSLTPLSQEYISTSIYVTFLSAPATLKPTFKHLFDFTLLALPAKNVCTNIWHRQCASQKFILH